MEGLHETVNARLAARAAEEAAAVEWTKRELTADVEQAQVRLRELEKAAPAILKEVAEYQAEIARLGEGPADFDRCASEIRVILRGGTVGLVGSVSSVADQLRIGMRRCAELRFEQIRDENARLGFVQEVRAQLRRGDGALLCAQRNLEVMRTAITTWMESRRTVTEP